MTDLINKHTLKIQLGVAAAVLVSIAYFIFNLSYFINKTESYAERLAAVEVEARKVPLLDQQLDTISADISDIKADIKILIRKN